MTKTFIATFNGSAGTGNSIQEAWDMLKELEEDAHDPDFCHFYEGQELRVVVKIVPVEHLISTVTTKKDTRK